MKKKFKLFWSVVLASALMVSSCGCGTKEIQDPEPISEVQTEGDTTQTVEATFSDVEGNLITNGFFGDSDVSAWSIESGASTVSVCAEGNPPEGYESYGKIDRDPSTSSPYDCFAQDVTATIQSGVTYDYEFYAMLSDDYKDAPPEQRVVDFAPYITVNGSTTYLGSYSAEITGIPSQTLEAGVWTRFAGTFTPSFSGEAEKVVIRIIEQGTDYGSGDCVKGDYYIAGVKLVAEGGAADTEVADKGYEPDITALKSVVASADGLGDDAICGVCFGNAEINDTDLVNIVEKHFNAVTLENELKPDAMFGYNNDAPASGSIHEEELNGETIEVPTLDHSRADAILDTILEWNEANPDQQIKVRGHVLVWHSQTPEWFFHEGYDKKNDYVSAEVMNQRLEWYIKSMLEYYTGEDSKYKGMFYGWDVVNEAISDNTHTYRTDEEPGNDKLSDSTHGSKSSWWKVYGSNEFIINAFKYANTYAPEDLELYYNDYNETDSKKTEGIVQLINDVKAADGTRIDGFGMQGHYTVSAPSKDQIENAVRAYSEVVDKVMITELDVKVSALYDGSDESMAEELERQAAYYSIIYETLKELDAEDGIEVAGMTIWGVIDRLSWLQQQSDLGGGATGNAAQFPLLFDDNYKAKPCFYALIDPSTVDTSILEVERPTIEIKKGTPTIDGEIDDVWNDAEDISLDIIVQTSDDTCKTKLLWDETNLYVLFDVTDAKLNDDSEDAWQQDSIEVFIDENNARSGGYDEDDKQYRVSYNDFHSFNGEKCLEENMKASVVLTDNGYMVEAAFAWTDITPEVGTQIGLELQVNDATSLGERCGTLSWADDTGTCYMNPAMFGHADLVE